MNKVPQPIECISTHDDWTYSSYEECEDSILRGLAKAWYNAKYIPQNHQQYRAAILRPAIEARVAELQNSTHDLAGQLAQHLGDQWTECYFDGVGEGFDIGVAIRASAKAFLKMKNNLKESK